MEKRHRSPITSRRSTGWRGLHCFGATTFVFLVALGKPLRQIESILDTARLLFNLADQLAPHAATELVPARRFLKMNLYGLLRLREFVDSPVCLPSLGDDLNQNFAFRSIRNVRHTLAVRFYI